MLRAQGRVWAHTLTAQGRVWAHTLTAQGRVWAHTLTAQGRVWAHTLKLKDVHGPIRSQLNDVYGPIRLELTRGGDGPTKYSPPLANLLIVACLAFHRLIRHKPFYKHHLGLYGLNVETLHA